MDQLSSDMVVVGAGSAGAIIAARVSERSDRQVLLLEAGPDYPEDGVLPADLRDGTRNSWRPHDWGYRYRPTPGQILFTFPRGKVVGGSSAVNTCIALRGLPYDYDEWASLGLPEWSFERCLPYFNRLEDDRDFGDAAFHGKGGPIAIRRHPPSELVPWQAAFVEASRNLGYPACADTNDPHTRGGVGPHAMNKIDGVRQSTARCYLTAQVRARDNFRLRASTLVRRVLFDGKRVSGLEVERDGAIEVLHTPKVVLAGGAIATPGILLRSGVGPRHELERLGVPLVSDVPAVGARLLDHPGTAIILRSRWRASTLQAPLIQTVLRYTSKNSPFPNDMQVQPGSFLPIHPRLTLPTFTMMCCIGKPKGHGTLHFRSADPHQRPEMHAGMLIDKEDHARAVEALQIMYEHARSPEMRALAGFFWPNERTLGKAAELGKWIFKATGSGYHPCGTVPMGPEGAADAAVDSRGRVRGVEGLTVADASIFPTVPSANTNLTALMVGERFGEWLREGQA